MCEPDFTLCFLKGDTPLREGWMCVNGFPTQDSVDDYLKENIRKFYYSRIFIYNSCWPSFVKSRITRKKLMHEITITENEYKDINV